MLVEVKDFETIKVVRKPKAESKVMSIYLGLMENVYLSAHLRS